jgi:hypothetical protein
MFAVNMYKGSAKRSQLYTCSTRQKHALDIAIVVHKKYSREMLSYLNVIASRSPASTGLRKFVLVLLINGPTIGSSSSNMQGDILKYFLKRALIKRSS